MNDKKIIKMDNKVVEAKFDLKTSEEMKILGLVLAQISIEDENFKDYIVDIKELEKLSGKTKNKKQIKEIAKKMLKKTIFLEENEDWVGYTLFSKIHYVAGKAILKIQMHPEVRRLFLKLKNNFTIMNLINFLSLDSYYSIRFYMLLRQYQKIGKRIFDMDNLREILNTPKSYSNFALFQKKVLEIAIPEINKKTELDISWSINKKRGKKIESIEFIIKQKISNDDKNFNSMNEFRKSLIQKGEVYIILDNENSYYKLEMGYLFDKNDNIIDKNEALKIWNFLYKNIKNIKIYDKERFNKIVNNKQIDLKEKILEIQKKEYYQIIKYDEDNFDKIAFYLQIENFDTSKKIIKGKLINKENNTFFIDFKTNVDNLINYENFIIDINNSKKRKSFFNVKFF